MGLHFSSILLYSFASLFILACGNSGEPLETKGPIAIKLTCKSEATCPSTGQCGTSPFIGDSRIVSLPDIPIDSGFFEKFYSQQAASALFELSGLAAWQSILSSGVLVNKIVINPDKQCRFFSPLRSTRLEIEKQWKSLNSSSGPRNFLLGLFTTKIQQRTSGGPGQLITPTITVSEDTEKWTLLHEYYHFLFARERVKDPNFSFDKKLTSHLEELSRNTENQMKLFGRKPTPKIAEELAYLLNEFFDISFELDSRGPLEEFAIEGLLIGRVLRDQEVLLFNVFGLSEEIKKILQDNLKITLAKKEFLPIEMGPSSLRSQQERHHWNRALGQFSELQETIVNHIQDINQKVREAARIARQADSFSRYSLPKTLETLKNTTVSPIHHYNDRIFKLKSSYLEKMKKSFLENIKET